MMNFKADNVPYNVVCSTDLAEAIYPLVRNDMGQHTISCVSPTHGRSFVLRTEENGRWIVGKGNGLSYTTHPFVLTSPVNGETWGGLSLDNAVRDFNISNEIRRLGIKTNKMEYVLSLDANIIQGGKQCQAALLQYSVECPYRICDFGFIPKEELLKTISRWSGVHLQKHLYAAEILVENLRILHHNNIMHNAMHPQNYTWALELVDFEASRTDTYPYDNADYEEYVPMLIKIEVIQTYEIVNYIAWCLGEIPDYCTIEKIFQNKGFEIKELQVKQR